MKKDRTKETILKEGIASYEEEKGLDPGTLEKIREKWAKGQKALVPANCPELMAWRKFWFELMEVQAEEIAGCWELLQEIAREAGVSVRGECNELLYKKH